MPHRLPTPKTLSEIRDRILTYVIRAPDFTRLREVTTCDFTADDVLETIEAGLSASAKKVAAKMPEDPGRPARWIARVQESRRLLRDGDVRGSIDCMAALQREYYDGPPDAKIDDGAG